MGTGILSCCKNKNEDNAPVAKKISGNDASFVNEENTPGNENANSEFYDNKDNRSMYSRKKAPTNQNTATYQDTNVNNGSIFRYTIGNNSEDQDNEDKTIRKIFFYFERFEMTYKYYDDFGLVFDPLVRFKLNNEIEQDFEQKQFETEDGQINNLRDDVSFHQPGDRSFVKDNKDLTSNNNTINLEKMNSNQQSNVGKSDSKFYIIDNFKIVDVFDMDNWPTKKLVLTVFNKSKTQQYNHIQVGVCYIPLIVLLEEGVIEGRFPVKNKLTKDIGYLYMRIKCLRLGEELDEEIDTMKINENEEDTPAVTKFGNPNLFLPVPKQVLDYFQAANTLDYEDLDVILKNSFKLKKIDVLLNIKESEKGWDEIKSRQMQAKELERINSNPLTVEEIAEIICQALIKQQHMLIYGLINYLIVRLEKRDVNFFDEFLDIIHDKKHNKDLDFFNSLIYIFPTKNLVLVKQFLFFLYKLIELYREQEIEAENLTTKLDFEEIFNIMHDNFGHLHLILLKLKEFEYEEVEEVKQIIYWMLNNIMQLITPNFSDKISKLDVINKLYSVAFNNCIKLITKPKYVLSIFQAMKSDTESTALIVKVFRKGIQILLDDSNNFAQTSDNPKVVSTSIKNLLVNEEKAYEFLVFIQMALTSYVNYPEVFSSILLILIYFCSDYKYPIMIRRILDNVDISLLCSGFDFYRGNLKKIGKNINYFFYKLISHITEMSKSFEEEETTINFKSSEVKEICNEFLKLFKMKPAGKDKKTWEKSKSLLNFIKHKNIELHEVLSCIAANLTKNSDACNILCKQKCYFIQHIIEYFFTDLNREAIKKFLEKFKSNKMEKAALYISIIDNSIQTFDNLITRSSNTKDFFMNFLLVKNITKNRIKYHITDLLDTTATALNFNNQKLKKTAENFMQNLD
jgi:hypothetical protein